MEGGGAATALSEKELLEFLRLDELAKFFIPLQHHPQHTTATTQLVGSTTSSSGTPSSGPSSPNGTIVNGDKKSPTAHNSSGKNSPTSHLIEVNNPLLAATTTTTTTSTTTHNTPLANNNSGREGEIPRAKARSGPSKPTTTSSKSAVFGMGKDGYLVKKRLEMKLEEGRLGEVRERVFDLIAELVVEEVDMRTQKTLKSFETEKRGWEMERSEMRRTIDLLQAQAYDMAKKYNSVRAREEKRKNKKKKKKRRRPSDSSTSTPNNTPGTTPNTNTTHNIAQQHLQRFTLDKKTYPKEKVVACQRIIKAWKARRLAKKWEALLQFNATSEDTKQVIIFIGNNSSLIIPIL